MTRSLNRTSTKGSPSSASVEVDVLQHAFESRVVVFEFSEGLVEAIADLMVQVVSEVLPAGEFGDEEGVLVEVRVVGPLLGLSRAGWR